MDTRERTSITIGTTVDAPIEKVWKYFSEPEHITQWAYAVDDWHAPYAENDLRTDGRFKTTMAARDGSVSFDFTGVYTDVQPHKRIAYTIDDGRKVETLFESNGNTTKITQTFEAEDENPVDMQRAGWQAILDNFKKHVERRRDAPITDYYRLPIMPPLTQSKHSPHYMAPPPESSKTPQDFQQKQTA